MQNPQVLTPFPVADGQPLVTTVVNGKPYVLAAVLAPASQLPLSVDGVEVASEDLGQMVCHSDGTLFVYCANTDQVESNEGMAFMELVGMSSEGLKSDFWGSRPPRIPNGQ